MKKDWMIKESELDDDQIKILTATLNKSCIVEGCAGSGKSVLALIKAQRIQKEEGNNYEIIVFTKALCLYMNSGRLELGLHNEFTYYWDWKYRKQCPHADYVIVDEIQDFDRNEIQDFINAADKEYFFFGDTAQSIYDGMNGKQTIPVDQIPYLKPPMKGRPKMWELYRNYRLPLPVARFVQHVGVDLGPFEESTYKSSENQMPFVLYYNSTNDQLKGIIDIIKKRSLTDVAILLPNNADVRDVSTLFRKEGLNVEQKSENKDDWTQRIDNLNFSTTNAKVMTYHSAKGLQFEAVFIPYLADAISDKERKVLYVAMTRTYRYLYVMYSGNMPAPINMIPPELYKTTLVENIEEI